MLSRFQLIPERYVSMLTRDKKTALELLYYWSNEANYWQTRNTRGLFATAELLFS